MEFEIDGDAVRIRKARKSRARGRKIVAHLKGRATTGLTTDEIMALMRG